MQMVLIIKIQLLLVLKGIFLILGLSSLLLKLIITELDINWKKIITNDRNIYSKVKKNHIFLRDEYSC